MDGRSTGRGTTRSRAGACGVLSYSAACAAVLMVALAGSLGCSTITWRPRPAPTYPGTGTNPGQNPGPNPGQNPSPTPNPSPDPGPTTPPPQAPTSSGLVVRPVAIHGQVSRVIDSTLADALPSGFTFEARIEWPPSNLPIAIEPGLVVTEARDERGKDYAGASSEPAAVGSSSIPSAASPGARWYSAVPAGFQSKGSAPASWKRYGLDSLPRTLTRLRGYAVCYTVAESLQRDVGISSARPAAELMQGLRISVRSVQRAGDAVTVETTLERSAPLSAFSGSNTEVPRIIGATVLDQRGAPVATAPILSGSFILPSPGQRSWPLTLSFTCPASTRPTTLRLVLATRLEKVQAPFDLSNVPVSDGR